MAVATIGRRGQLTLPKDIRRVMEVEEGDKVAFIAEGSTVYLRPLKQTLLDLRGSIQVEGEQDFEAIRRQVIEERSRNRAKRDA